MKDRKKQSWFFGCLITVGVFLIIIAVMASIKVTKYAVYRDAVTGMQIKYPTHWTLHDKPQGGAIVAFMTPQELGAVLVPNVNITMNDFSATPMSPEEFSKLTIFQVTKTFDPFIEILESKSITLANRPGHRFVYAGKTDTEKGVDNPSQFMHVWVVDANRAYIITYLAPKNEFKKHLRIVNAMIKSFKLDE